MRRAVWLRRLSLVVVCGAALEGALRLLGAIYLGRFHAAAAGPLDAVRLVCLGESSTAGLWLERSDSYPGQLETALRHAYADDRIQVIVPPHIGQNTSQMAHRIDAYLDRYRPRLVVVMAGYNNEWSLAESEIGRFLENRWERWRAELLVRLEALRLFRLVRWTTLRLSHGADVGRNPEYVWGAPEFVRYPPAAEVYTFAASHRSAFVALWRHDLRHVLERARARGAKALLMTYHINPSYLPPEEFESLARDQDAALVRNDRGFERAIERASASELLFHDDWHPNRKGYAVIARGAFDAIVSGDLLDLGVPSHGGWPDQGGAAPALPAAGLAMGELGVEAWLGAGWSRPENGFRWTDGPLAEIRFATPAWSSPTLSLRMRPFLVPGRLGRQRVGIAVNDRPAALWQLDHAKARTWRVLLDGRLRDANTVTFSLQDAASPRSLGAGPDDRRLALAVERVFLGPPALRIGDIDVEPFLGDGWGEDEGGFHWTVARTAEILFRTERNGPKRLAVRLSPFLAGGRLRRQRVTLALEGTAPRTEELRLADPTLLEVALPAGAASHRLRLELPDAVAPAAFGEADGRSLGIALHGLAGRR